MFFQMYILPFWYAIRQVTYLSKEMLTLMPWRYMILLHVKDVRFFWLTNRKINGENKRRQRHVHLQQRIYSFASFSCLTQHESHLMSSYSTSVWHNIVFLKQDPLSFHTLGQRQQWYRPPFAWFAVINSSTRETQLAGFASSYTYFMQVEIYHLTKLIFTLISLFKYLNNFTMST